MLAVFKKEVGKCPEELKNGESCLSLKEDLLLQHFSSIHPDAVSLNLGGFGFLAFSSHLQNPLLPRLFTVVDDIFCLFQGHIENIAPLKQLYGLTKTANEVNIIVEAYRALRDRGASPTDHALRNFEGKFAFIIYDGSSRTTFFSVDADGSAPLFWGTTSEEHLVLSDDIEVVKKACGRSFAPFPKGCFFTSSNGLKSYEHPRKELKPIPWVDSSGQTCGATFMVSEDPKKETSRPGISFGMPRVASDADWSNKI
ncbi:stem-specific protein TSJT1-like [Silene latifolia]|uniref:stem-specific protein TSJT1-like n=1 Tax=Silene latifolia TaxID=37657 RepID=UPI003D786452